MTLVHRGAAGGGEVLRLPVADVRLGRLEVAPIRGDFGALRYDRDQLGAHAPRAAALQQPLNVGAKKASLLSQ